MRKVLFLILLCFLVFFSGCVDQRRNKNEIITQTSLQVLPSTLRGGSTTTISFNVKNVGEKEVERVEVVFFDVGGFEIEDIRCEDGVTLDNGCLFENLEAFGSRNVRITLRAPRVYEPTDFTLSYYLEFPYHAYREILIPAVNLDERPSPYTKLRESDENVGPILLEFQFLGGVERKEGERIERGYWLFRGQKFSMQFDFKNVGKGSTDLKEGDVRLVLDGVSIDSESPCDFDSSGVSTQTLKVPGTLFCGFVVEDFEEPEVIVKIGVEYDYVYQILESVTLRVLP